MSILVGQRIRELRIQNGLTQTQLADGIVTPSMISQIEAGKAQPSNSLLKKLAIRLETPLDELSFSPSHDLTSQARIEVIRACVALGQYEQAEILLDTAFEPLSGRLELFYLKGKVLFAQQHLPEAANAFRQALSAAREQGEPEYMAELYMLLGDIYQQASDYDTAIHLYQQALLALREHLQNSVVLEADITLRLSITHAALHHTTAALAYAHQAGSRMALLDHSRNLAQQHVKQAIEQLQAGNETEAKRLAVEANTMNEVFHWLSSSIQTTLILAERLIESEEYSTAATHLDACLTRSQTYATSEELAQLLLLQSKILFRQGRVTEGLAKTQSAISLDAKPTATKIQSLLGASEVALATDQPEVALTFAQQAYDESLQLQNRVQRAEACKRLSHTYRQLGRHEEAKRILQNMQI